MLKGRSGDRWPIAASDRGPPSRGVSTAEKCPDDSLSNVLRTEAEIEKGKENHTSSTSILQGKCADVFGAGGSIGTAVAREFAAEGAEVFISGRTKPTVEAIARQITANSGKVHATVVDTLNDAAVNEYLDDVVKQGGKIDVILDAAGPLAKEYGNGKIAVDLPVEQFMVPLAKMVKSRCPHVPGAIAIGAAFGAIENLAANLAFEVSPFGVRVVCLRTLAIPTAGPFRTRWTF
jgi:short subunit dehydrogenase